MRSKNIQIFLACLLLGLSMANFASAALVTCGGYNDNGTPQTDCKLTDLIFLINRIINFLLSWAWIISMFYIMWAGYNMIFAGGNEEALSAAKTQFSHAVIGFVLIMASYILVNWVVSLFSGTGNPADGQGSFDFFRHLIKP